MKTLISPQHLEEIANVYKPVYEHLSDKQKEILWDNSAYKIIQGVRRSGKTRILVSLALLHAICAGPKNIIFVVHSNITINFIQREIHDLWCKLKTNISMSRNSNTMLFSNGSSIEVCCYQTEKNHFYSCDLLLMDEAALYGNFTGNLVKLWNRLRGTPEIIISSTRVSRSKKNFFWNWWLNAVNQKSYFRPFTISNKDNHYNNISNIKKMMRRSEYDKQFTIRWK